MSATPMKCLLVDDDSSMLEVLSRCVETLGFEPITAQDGDDGLLAFEKYHPNLVVSDIHMPNRNGLLLLKDIKLQNPEVPVILITGWLHYKAVMNSEHAVPDAFMEKPFTLTQLRATIEKLHDAIDRAWKSE